MIKTRLGCNIALPTMEEDATIAVMFDQDAAGRHEATTPCASG
jgi:hypothetical protein